MLARTSNPEQFADIVHRTDDAEAVNAFVNHPDVLPHLSLGIFTTIDMTPLLRNQRNLCFIGTYGGAILVWSGPGVYDAHNFILPEGRGKWGKDACLAILRLMFDVHGARMVWAQTPVTNRACRMLNRMLGFKSLGIDRDIILPGTETPGDFEVFAMEQAPCR